MVEDEAQVAVSLRACDRCGQLAGPNEEIERKVGVGNRPEASLHVAANDPVRIWLVVNLVPDADEPSPGEGGKCAGDLVGRGEIDPADHADHPGRRLGDLEKLLRLVERRSRLDDNRSVDPIRLEFGCNSSGPKRLRRLGTSSRKG